MKRRSRRRCASSRRGPARRRRRGRTARPSRRWAACRARSRGRGRGRCRSGSRCRASPRRCRRSSPPRRSRGAGSRRSWRARTLAGALLEAADQQHPVEHSPCRARRRAACGRAGSGRAATGAAAAAESAPLAGARSSPDGGPGSPRVSGSSIGFTLLIKRVRAVTCSTRGSGRTRATLPNGKCERGSRSGRRLATVSTGRSARGRGGRWRENCSTPSSIGVRGRLYQSRG